jgi:hypothetical protein
MDSDVVFPVPASPCILRNWSFDVPTANAISFCPFDKEKPFFCSNSAIFKSRESAFTTTLDLAIPYLIFSSA